MNKTKKKTQLRIDLIDHSNTKKLCLPT